jgi:hypothetical protein
MSELPPLPDTRDPFVLLGVSRDADERTLKKAYARLIKVYRPDRSPAQFERIHAAFELARDLAGRSAHPERGPEGAESKGPVPDPGPEPDETLAYPDLRRHISTDPAAVSAILLSRFEALLVERRYPQVVAELRDPTLRADAEEHVAVAIPALRAIAALAWRSDDARSLLESYCTIPREHGLERLLDRVEHELELSTRWRAALGAGALRGGILRPAHAADFPEPLISLVADTALSSPRRRGALIGDLDRLLRDPRRLLDTCDRIVAADPHLAHLLVHRFHAETPRGDRTLSSLQPALFDEVGQAIVDLERSLHAPVRPWMIAAGAVGGVAGAATVLPLAIGAGIALGSAGLGSIQLALAKNRYLQRVRPGLAAIVARLGVQASVLREWLSFNRKLAGDLATYDISVDGDLGLALLGSIAAIVREAQRGPLDDDDGGDDDDGDDEHDDPGLR